MSESIAIGIDLGTSNSCVSIIAEGQPQVVTNEWGETVHASVVSFLDGGAVLVGNEAKRRMADDPSRTISSAKRIIGRYFFSEEVKRARERMPYEIVEGPNHGVRIQVRDQLLSVPEVSALVLKEMKELAATQFPGEARQAVITCPAYFNDNQRQATRDAAQLAGLQVLRIINEPTAAALAYGYGKGLSQKVAVYDLGGGTFDISILELGEDIFEVLSTAGDTYLGGDDFDDRIVDWLVNKFREETGLDLSQNKWCLHRLKEAGERAKIDLSSADAAEIVVERLCKDPSGKVLDLRARLSREEFGAMVHDLIQRTFKVCDEALQSARLTAQEIDAVVLVGGSTRMPSVHQGVAHYFGKAPLGDIDPDHVVAVGAAIHANSLLGKEGTSTVLLDVTPLPLRVATVGGFAEAVLEKNTPVPIERSKIFTTSRDGQEKVRIEVLQGESALANECESLGAFEFSGFRKAGRGEVEIEVVFEIDTDGIVNVTARDKETGQQATTTIHLSSGLSAEEIAEKASRIQNTPMARSQAG